MNSIKNMKENSFRQIGSLTNEPADLIQSTSQFSMSQSFSEIESSNFDGIS